MSRILGALRLSKKRDESTSIARQRDEIQRWADYKRHEVVGWAEDSDVSGSVSPFDRAGLGPWLTSRVNDWDILVTSRVDRVSRSSLHTHSLVDWLKTREKHLVCTTEGIDTSQPGTAMLLAVLAALAEGEREAIRERSRDSYAHLRREGRWGGGQPPYGYWPVPRPGGGYRLEVDTAARDIVRELAQRIIAGETVNALCQELNARKVPSPADHSRIRAGDLPKGTRWANANTRRLLTSETLMGRTTETLRDNAGREVQRVYRDGTGLPMQRAVPLLGEEEWGSLQAALGSTRAPRRATKHPRALLTSILFCECGWPMYRVPGSRPYRSEDPVLLALYGGRPTGRYRCSQLQRTTTACPSSSIREDKADTEALALFLSRVGSMPVQERVHLPGNDVAAQRAAVAASLTELLEDRASGRYRSALSSRIFGEQTTALEAEAQRLEELPVVEERWELLDTGATYLERLAGGAQGRGVIAEDMRRIGVALHVSLDHEMSLELPDDLAARLRQESTSPSTPPG